MQNICFIYILWVTLCKIESSRGYVDKFLAMWNKLYNSNKIFFKIINQGLKVKGYVFCQLSSFEAKRWTEQCLKVEAGGLFAFCSIFIFSKLDRNILRATPQKLLMQGHSSPMPIYNWVSTYKRKKLILAASFRTYFCYFLQKHEAAWNYKNAISFWD